MIFRKYQKYILHAAFFIFFFFFVSGVSAGVLKFDLTTIETDVDDTFDVQLIVDAGTDEINSIDAYIKYDSEILQAESVEAGTFFPSIAQNLTTGTVYVAGYVDDPATSKSGTGTVATITFKALQSGTSTLTYFCDSSVNESSKVVKNDINATNVIVCESNGSSTVTVGEGSDTTGDTDDATGTGGTSDATTLPTAGTLENLLAISIPGLLLLAVGILFKFL